jgi:hypothetical protein
MRTLLKVAGAAVVAATLSAPLALPANAADDTIKVGVLHSLSGTMAISETTLKDTILYLIDEQNKKGGLLGKKLLASASPNSPSASARSATVSARRYALIAAALASVLARSRSE